MQKTAFWHLWQRTGMREVFNGIGWVLTQPLQRISLTSFGNNPSWAVNVSVLPGCLSLSFVRESFPPAVTCNSSRPSGSAASANKTPSVSPLACNVHPTSTDQIKRKNIDWLTAKSLQVKLDCQHRGRVHIPAGDIQRCLLHVKDEPLKEIRRVFVWLRFLKNVERYLRWCLFAFKGSKLMYFSGLEGSHFLSGRRSRSHSAFFPRQYLCVSVWDILNLWLGQ